MKTKFAMVLFVIISLSTVKAQSSGPGLGLIVGEPTGISFKYWTSSTTPEGTLPFYYGIGARIKTANDTKLGVRVPLGLAYLFSNTPIDIFLEIVPILDLTPKTDFSINAAIGARYFFN
ncbi:MAG: hypothetical protein MUE93_01075 [Ignavibacteriaceae bacterium]|nr:hypothetical protein [Ignavibacteriaceae bacterium]